jgi:4'-phosphopantetheinyl transferase
MPGDIPVIDQWQVNSFGRDVSLGVNEIHVWKIDLDQPKFAVQEILGNLSSDELERANKYKFEKDSRRFIAARGGLRQILSVYTGIIPNELRFGYSSHGKPELSHQSSLRFNFSHSESLALFAVTVESEIGIDVERIRPIPEMDTIAKQTFPARAYEEFISYPQNLKQNEFFRNWTKWEAYLKAIGKGIASDTVISDGQGWSFHSFIPIPDYIASIAFPVSDFQIRFWELDWM